MLHLGACPDLTLATHTGERYKWSSAWMVFRHEKGAYTVALKLSVSVGTGSARHGAGLHTHVSVPARCCRASPGLLHAASVPYELLWRCWTEWR